MTEIRTPTCLAAHARMFPFSSTQMGAQKHAARSSSASDRLFSPEPEGRCVATLFPGLPPDFYCPDNAAPVALLTMRHNAEFRGFGSKRRIHPYRLPPFSGSCCCHGREMWVVERPNFKQSPETGRRLDSSRGPESWPSKKRISYITRD